MDKSPLEKSILETDWSRFDGPEEYNPDEVAPALLDLLHLQHEGQADRIQSMVLFAVGNNHRGTYYPALAIAIDFIIEIERQAASRVGKNSAREILYDLKCFEPDQQGQKVLSQEDHSRLQQKLKPFANWQ
ncbi:hypothetical protein [Roseibium sp.]|uniref:hypothetical protein n=1 Tax=Roseibium sp. TaxID=1936156 RepID=UPI003BAF0702